MLVWTVPEGESARPFTVSRLLQLLMIYGGSRVVGLTREIGVAVYFGTSAAADRLNVTFVVASLATIILGEAVYAGCVRTLTDSPRQTSARKLDAATYGRLLASARRTAVLGAAVYMVLGPLIAVAVLGRWERETVVLALLLAPSVATSVISACINARLTIERRIGLMTGAQALYSVGAVCGIGVVALTGAGPEPVAIGWSVGNVAAAVLIYVLARPPGQVARPAASAMAGPLRVGFPVAVAFVFFALQGLTDRAVASRLGPGSVAALGYADRLYLLPTGFVLAALGPLVLSSLTTSRAHGPGWTSTLAADHVRAVASVTIPIGLAATALSPELVRALFEYGAFTAVSAVKTTRALDGFCVGLAAASVLLLLIRTMQAQLPLRMLAIVAAGGLALNAVLTIVLSYALGLFGVTLATSIVALLTALMQSRLLAHGLGPPWSTSIGPSVLAPLSASFALALAIAAGYQAHAFGAATRAGLGVLLALAAALVLVRRRDSGQAR